MALLFLLLAWALPAHALTLASPAAGNAFPHVGRVGGTSGVLIAPNWVLTAGHVGAVGGSFSSELGSSAIDGKYTPAGSNLYNADIGLLHLAAPLASAAAFPILNSVAIESSQLGGSVTLTSGGATTPMVGIATAAGVVDSFVLDGTRHIPHWLLTYGGVRVQGGDSGGGLFLGNADHSAGAALLGVASASVDAGGGVVFSGFVQTAFYRAWIDSTMASHDPGQLALWAPAISPVPELPTFVMLFFGIGLLYGRHNFVARS